MSLLQMSFKGAVIILIITVIRALFINRFPKRVFLALWGVVLFRLLVPFSFPAAFSIYSLIWENETVADTVKDTPAEKLLFESSRGRESKISPSGIFAKASAGNLPKEPEMADDVPARTQVGMYAQPWVLAYILGAVLCSFYFLAAYVKCRREFAVSLPVDNEFMQDWLRTHQLRRKIALRQSGCISAPLTYGVISPVILLPKSAGLKLDGQCPYSISFILEHEFIHIKRLDAITKIILTVCLCIHWFNPMVWIMYILSNRDLELSCDEAVVRRFGESTKASYARMLISMEEKKMG